MSEAPIPTTLPTTPPTTLPTVLPPTPGQTVGPFFGYALPYGRDNELVEAGAPGAVRLHGTVRDGAGQPIPDALLELWQPGPDGQVVQRSGSLLRDGTFTGWGRAETDRDGGYRFRTLVPGPTAPGRAAFFAVALFARGLSDRLFTRIYLPDAAALDADPFLASLEPERRRTLVAAREPDGALRFDVRMQGEGETVFLRFDRPDVGSVGPDGDAADGDAADGDAAGGDAAGGGARGAVGRSVPRA